MCNKRILLLFVASILSTVLFAGADRWQQRVEYLLEINFDAKKHQFAGTQKLVYHNNSPDQLQKVFYHLYFNAFQPGSMMDVRSRTLPDPDPRLGDRIARLKEDEIGFLRIKSLRQDGKPVSFEEVGTILEVTLAEPIAPGSIVVFEMEFKGQVPLQIRRNGRNNKEGIDYSMAQWYPKMCEYDYQGWHANPYVGREFYGVWGDFDVKITINSNYVLGGTGYLQNPKEVGHGYGDMPPGPASKKKNTTWHFVAPNVHDFVWAADPDYTHVKRQAKEGPMMHFLYQKGEATEAWEQLPEKMEKVFTYVNKRFGNYPYEQYSFIQGGDGGMEYPMATLIRGHRHLGSLVGVSIHELMHSWYHMILGFNESLYSWMDEGFTEFTEERVKNWLRQEGIMPGKPKPFPYKSSYARYANFTTTPLEEPLTTHADHFITNTAYGIAAYTKGAIFLNQMEYVVGKQAFDRGMLEFFDLWKFKHPNANDFIRVMEKVSALELDWYKEYWVNTTHIIDFEIDVASVGNNTTEVKLKKIGTVPMPLDVVVTYKDGRQEIYNIPLRIMRGEKPAEHPDMKYIVLEDWPWTHPTYNFKIDAKQKDIKRIEIDPTFRMADVDLENNVFSAEGPEE